MLQPHLFCRGSESARDGALLRYPRDLVGAPTTVASGLSIASEHLHIVADHALLGLTTFVRLSDGALSAVSTNVDGFLGFDADGRGVAADAQAAYTPGH